MRNVTDVHFSGITEVNRKCTGHSAPGNVFFPTKLHTVQVFQHLFKSLHLINRKHYKLTSVLF